MGQRPVKVITPAELEENGGIYKLQGGAAIRVRGSSSGGEIDGGALHPVYVVSDADVSSGRFKLLGGFEEAVSSGITTRPVSGNIAVPVWAINSSEWPGGGVSPITYGINDLYTDTLAPGSVDGTNATPGPGLRNVADTAGTRVEVGSDNLSITGNGAWNQAGIWYTPTISRSYGIVIRSEITFSSGSGQGMMLLTTDADANFSGYNSVGLMSNSSGSFRARRFSDASSPILNIVTRMIGEWYIVLRGVGRYILHAPDSSSDIDLLWWDSFTASSPLHVGATHFSTNFRIDYENMQSPSSTTFEIGTLATASDSFNRADGTMGSTDGAGHTEADGGSGVAWVSDTGTWGIVSNEAKSSALSGGIAVATVPTPDDDVLIECDLTRSGGEVGIAARWADSSNNLIAIHDGTNCILRQTLSGFPFDAISAVATYSAGAAIRLHLRGQRALLYYNDLYIGTYSGVSLLLTSTDHGLYTDNIANTFDNFILFERTGYNAIRDGF